MQEGGATPRDWDRDGLLLQGLVERSGEDGDFAERGVVEGGAPRAAGIVREALRIEDGVERYVAASVAQAE